MKCQSRPTQWYFGKSYYCPNIYTVEIGLDDSENSLANMIMQRQAKREAEADSFFDHLAAKYGGGGSTKKGSPSKKTKKGSKKK